MYDGVMIENASIAKLNFIADDGERADADVSAKPHPRRDDGMRMNFGH